MTYCFSIKLLTTYVPLRYPAIYSLHFHENRRRVRSCHLDHLSLVSDIQPTISAKYSKNTVDGSECKVFEGSFFYRSHLAWNNLPLDIREIPEPTIFRTRLRQHLWSEALHSALSEYRDTHMPLKFSSSN